jgi:hypothetical protein
VGETAYTNPLFVALTEVAALNGDHATPSVFLSIQSDESRHMANGYATLAAVISEPENHAFLQADLDRVFWRNHVFLDPLLFLRSERWKGQSARDSKEACQSTSTRIIRLDRFCVGSHPMGC